MLFQRQNQRIFSNEQLDNRFKAGLVGHWVGNVNGNRWLDRSGYGNHGTLVGGPTQILGCNQQRNALQFDGTDDEVTIPEITLTGVFSSCCFVMFPNYSTGTNLNPFGSGVASFGYHMLFGSGNLYLSVAGGYYPSTPPALSSNVWYHFGFTRDASNLITYYMNGRAYATMTGSGTTSVNKLANGNVFTKCSIDDARVYTRCLSAAEMAVLGNQSFTSTITRYPVYLKSSSSLITVDSDIVSVYESLLNINSDVTIVYSHLIGSNTDGVSTIEGLLLQLSDGSLSYENLVNITNDGVLCDENLIELNSDSTLSYENNLVVNADAVSANENLTNINIDSSLIYENLNALNSDGGLVTELLLSVRNDATVLVETLQDLTLDGVFTFENLIVSTLDVNVSYETLLNIYNSSILPIMWDGENPDFTPTKIWFLEGRIREWLLEERIREWNQSRNTSWRI